ncbi:hypothetical protein ABZ656_08095 [Streptomyces sp. NPDC007095]|uniref:hypothetical protein n=1 Tax=Streptomyces sp. NPDC007095 TaxID=3154482 RepID=UPI000C6FFB89
MYEKKNWEIDEDLASHLLQKFNLVDESALAEISPATRIEHVADLIKRLERRRGTHRAWNRVREVT